MNVHVPRPFDLCREIAELQACRTQGVCFAHAAFPQFVRPFRYVEREFTLQIPLYAAGPYDVPKPFNQAINVTCYA